MSVPLNTTEERQRALELIVIPELLADQSDPEEFQEDFLALEDWVETGVQPAHIRDLNFIIQQLGFPPNLPQDLSSTTEPQVPQGAEGVGSNEVAGGINPDLIGNERNR